MQPWSALATMGTGRGILGHFFATRLALHYPCHRRSAAFLRDGRGLLHNLRWRGHGIGDSETLAASWALDGLASTRFVNGEMLAAFVAAKFNVHRALRPPVSVGQRGRVSKQGFS